MSFSAAKHGFVEISRSSLFKSNTKTMLIPLSYVLRCFRNFWVVLQYINSGEKIVFEGLVKLGAIRNGENLM